jgi:hypothetical protein
MTIRSSPKRGNPRVADRDQERKPGLALFLDDGGDLSYSDQFPRGRGRVSQMVLRGIGVSASLPLRVVAYTPMGANP